MAAKPDWACLMARICLVSHNASGAFQEGEAGHIGGVERQTQLLARWLAGRGHDVIVITWLDRGLGDWVDRFGVKILGTCEPNRGIRWLRFFHPKWTSLISALRRADADIYYHNAAESVTGQIAMWCRLHRRRFVYSVASEPACKISLPTLGNVLPMFCQPVSAQ